MGDGSNEEKTQPNGMIRASSSATPSAAALFSLLWDALVDLLGTAATAALLRRAAQSACRVNPELAEVYVTREGLDYRYSLPGGWHAPAGAADRAFRQLVAELMPVLAELAGPVAARHLARVPELCERGVVLTEEERN